MSTTTRFPRIPREAAGLISALDADRAGDPIPLERWFAIGFPALVTSFTHAWFDAHEAEEIALKIVEAAVQARDRGEVVREEIPWMFRLAVNAHIFEWRRRRRMPRPLEAGPEPAAPAPPDPHPEADPHHLLLMEALHRLRTPYLDALWWELVDERGRAWILGALQEWGSIGTEGARQILRRAHRMLEAAVRDLLAEKVRHRPPLRQTRASRNSQFACTPPPGGPRQVGCGV